MNTQANHKNHRRVLPHERNIVFNVMNLSKPPVDRVRVSKEMLAQSRVPPAHFYSQMLAPKNIHRH